MTVTEQVHRVVVDGQPDQVAARTIAQERRLQPYVFRIAVTDGISVAVAVAVAYIVRFAADGSARVGGEFSPSYLVVSVVLFAAWTSALFLERTYDHRIIGAGPAEYQRVWQASWRLGALVAVVAYMLRMEIGRGYLGFAFPLGLAFVFVGRYSWRQWLHRQRGAGLLQSRVLVVGHLRKAALLITELKEAPNTGFGVIGACVPAAEVAGGKAGGVEILGTMDEVATLAVNHRVDIVAVVGSDEMTNEALRRLAWDLEGTGIDIALTIAIRDVAGPRVTMQPVNGLPLVYVDEPRFAGPKYVLKSVMDWEIGRAACRERVSRLV